MENELSEQQKDLIKKAIDKYRIPGQILDAEFKVKLNDLEQYAIDFFKNINANPMLRDDNFTVAKNQSGFFCLRTPDGNLIATFAMHIEENDPKVRLIKFAPELLYALTKLCNAVRNDSAVGQTRSECEYLLQSIIMD